MDFDESRLYYSHQQWHRTDPRTAAAADSSAGTLAEAAEDDGLRLSEGAEPEAPLSPTQLERARRHFREFLRNYRWGPRRYVYRDKLLRMHRRLFHTLGSTARTVSQREDGAEMEGGTLTLGLNADDKKNANLAHILVDLAHVGEYDPSLLGYVLHQPAQVWPALELAASDALATLLYDQHHQQKQQQQPGRQQEEQGQSQGSIGVVDTQPPLQGDATAPGGASREKNEEFDLGLAGLPIQVLVQGHLQPTLLRCIQSDHLNRLIKCPGMVISTSPVKHRAVALTIRCARCQHTRVIAANTEGPFGSVRLPANCPEPDCGRYPYTVVPDESRLMDQQTLKLQEAPDQVPTGEMPRSVLLALERSLVDVAPPGTRVAVWCIPTLFTSGGYANGASARTAGGTGAGPKSIYLRVVGLQKQADDAHGAAVEFTPAEEEAFTALAQRPDVYQLLSQSMAPNLSGQYTVDIKKALLCQLMGGCRKRLPDGVRLRGDINVLLLGDPSMAKSQFLKFVSKVAPVGIYTSGKGSSAAGLTASVVRDARGEFYLEGGAMVLADGGVVCIDEFDKMRPADRVAIHEAMEQQTISVAKAGITTVLNSRSSVLAAANPVHGRYDDFKSASENIDLMSTILSRFDLIFLVRDIREEERDRLICQHVMGVHIQSSRQADGGRLGQARLMPSLSTTTSDKGDLSYSLAGAGGLTELQESPEMGGGGLAAAIDLSSPGAIAENALKVALTGQGELEMPTLKKYIQYCKSRCSPRLSEEAGQVLTSSYVKIRDQVRKQGLSSGLSGNRENHPPTFHQQAAIPITVRQLEALVRLSESLAKMRLDDVVRPMDITEALRLFQVSTMAANAADQEREQQQGAGYMASLSAPHRQELERTEAFLRSRLMLGNMVNRQRLVEEAAGQGFHAVSVSRCLSVMVSRGEVLERNQGRLVKRVK